MPPIDDYQPVLKRQSAKQGGERQEDLWKKTRLVGEAAGSSLASSSESTCIFLHLPFTPMKCPNVSLSIFEKVCRHDPPSSPFEGL